MKYGIGLLFAVLLAVHSTPSTAKPLHCGVDMRLEVETVPPPPQGLQRTVVPLAEAQGTTIVLNASASLAAHPQALAAWQRAVAEWESHLLDNVTVTLEGDLQSMGGSILGATCFRVFDNPYDTVRNAMVADASVEETLVQGLPTGAQLSLIMPPLWFYLGDSIAAKANLRALGFDMSFDDPNPDGSITFNSDFLSSFDFDASDGIDSTKYDFEAIVIHEIGHALGFYTMVDQIDALLGLGVPGGTFITPLDCFRMRPGDGAAGFTLNPRLLTTGTYEAQQVLYEGAQDLAVSTGAQTGDGYQASHWKADEVSGTHIGMMDPTLAAGDHQVLTDNDLRLFGLIGWDLPATVSVQKLEPLQPQLQAYPNPFRSGTAFEFDRVPGEEPVRMRLVDVQGRQIRLWSGGELSGGRVSWDGRGQNGRPMPGGVYYLDYQSTHGRKTIPIVRLN